jgi:predicted nucleic acid-binding protein
LVSELFEPIPVSESIALEYGHLLALARTTGPIQKATDLFIAATAASTGRRLLTRDRSQASLAEEAKIPVSLV